MEIQLSNVTFVPASKEHLPLILEWFIKPHVCEYFDDPETGRSVPDLRLFVEGKKSFWQHWIGCYEGRPFMYLMTSEVKPGDSEGEVWRKWREKDGKTYSLDLFIGEDEFIGKGLSHEYIRKFMYDKFEDASAFLIDPEVANERAVHIYEKAGFKIMQKFAPETGEFAGVPHYMMKLTFRNVE